MLWALEGAAQMILCATVLVVSSLTVEVRTMRLGGVDHVCEPSWTSERRTRALFGAAMVVVLACASCVNAEKCICIMLQGMRFWADCIVTSGHRFATLVLINLGALPSLTIDT